MEGRRTRTDPTVWCFPTKGLGATYPLVAAYVDDFINTSILGQKFKQLKSALRERFRCGSWTAQSFGLCGVRVHQKVKHTIFLDQTSYVNSGVNPINVDNTHTHTPRHGPCGSNAVESDTGWTTAAVSVERDLFSRHLKWHDLAVIGYTDAAQGDKS